MLQLERQRIEEKLQELHLRLHEVKADGHCLFNAVSHQASIKLKKKVASIYRSNFF